MSRDWAQKVRDIKEYIDTHICDISNIYEISDMFHIQVNQLYSWFRVLFHTTPKEYLLDKKIEELTKILRSEGDGHVIFYYAYKLGFETESALCHLIKRKTNLTFTEFARKVLKN